MRSIHTAIIVITLMTLTSNANLRAQNANQSTTTDNDSISKADITNLEEVTVIGANTYMKDGVLNIIPTERQKQDAFDGTDLLARLSLPMLTISPVTKAITYAGTGNVSLYINGKPASKADIDAMKTTDVIRIEYLDYPTDPRFDHNDHVVNFIIQKYIYGGYTRATAIEEIRYLYSLANIYSKFEVNNVALDVYFSSNNSIQNNDISSSATSYLLKGADGSSQFLREENDIDASRAIIHNYPLTLRAQVSGNNYYISNSAGYTYDTNPVFWQRNNTQYSGLLTSNTSAFSSYRNRSSSVWYSGYYYLILPKDFTLKIAPSFTYGHFNRNSLYDSGIEGMESVINGSINDSYELKYDTFLQKNLGKHYVYLNVKGIHSWYDINYSGSTYAHSKMNSTDLIFSLCYGFSTKKLALSVDGAYVWHNSKTDGIIRHDGYPSFHLRASYNIRNNSILSLFMQYATYSATLSHTQSSIIQQNNFLYYTGNPGIKDYRFTEGNLTWLWMPSRMLNIFVRGYYNLYFNRTVPVYEPYKDGSAILMSWDNNGNTRNFSLYGGISFSNIANILTVGIQPELNFYHESGFYRKSMTCFNLGAYAYLSLPKGFSVVLSYNTPRKYYSQGTTSRSAPLYSLEASWSNKNLNISLKAINFLHSPKWTSKSLFETSVYTKEESDINRKLDRSVSISISYLFSYGKKKVRIGDELNGGKSATSGALTL